MPVSRYLLLLILLAALLLASCLRDEPVQGEVARINGRAISLNQLEAMHHALFVDEDVDSAEELEHLRRQYGSVLTELMAMELVKQELERKKLAVSPDELAAEEQLIRADYPPGTFDLALAEDAIDLDTWRSLLGNHIAMRKFRRQVLRPEVAIEPEEVEEYYFRHVELFVRPARLEYILVCGQVRETVEEAMLLLLTTLSPTEVRGRYPDVLISQSSLPQKRVAPDLLAVMENMAPGEASNVSRSRRGYSSILLLEREPESNLTPAEAYALIEEALLERKLQAAQNEWLKARFAKATIRVSPHLLPQPEKEEAGEAAAASGADSAQSPSAPGEGALTGPVGINDPGLNAPAEETGIDVQ